MSDLFYAHLVPVDETLQQLETLSITEAERDKLESMIITMYHKKILETILNEIDTVHHDHIVAMIAGNPYDLGVMIEIKSHNPDIEESIIDAGRTLSTEIRGLLATNKPKNP